MSKLIYIAGPYTAPTEELVKANVRRAEEVGQEVLLLEFIPVIPHKITSHWDSWGKLTHWTHTEWIFKFCKPLLLRCDGILLIEGWTESHGAKLEHDMAIDNGIPVAYKVSELLVIFR